MTDSKSQDLTSLSHSQSSILSINDLIKFVNSYLRAVDFVYILQTFKYVGQFMSGNA